MTVPYKITFYCRQPDEKGIHHTFPVDSEAKHDTAKSWARDTGYGRRAGTEPIVFEFDNTGFDQVYIKSLEKRGNGGRAYQVILERDGNKFRVDLREDALMDVILKAGIQRGGMLGGSFCFIKNSSQTQLIREGSEAHTAALKDRETREKFNKTISKKDLKPGYSYSTPSGKSAIYLGSVYTANVGDITSDKVHPTKHMLWLQYGEEKVIKYLKTGLQPVEKTERIKSWYFELTTSHSYKIEGGKPLDVSIEQIVSLLNELGKEDVEAIDKSSRSISFADSFTTPYRLSVMTLDRKTFEVDYGLIYRNMKKLDRSRW